MRVRLASGLPRQRRPCHCLRPLLYPTPRQEHSQAAPAALAAVSCHVSSSSRMASSSSGRRSGSDHMPSSDTAGGLQRQGWPDGPNTGASCCAAAAAAASSGSGAHA